MASIQQLPSGSWRWRIAAGVRHNGRTYQQVSGTAPTRREAEQDAARAARKVQAIREPGRARPMPTMRQWLDEHLAAKEASGLAASTMRRYRGLAEDWLIPHLGDIRVASLTVDDCDRLWSAMADAGQAQASMRQAREVLSGALRAAERRSLVDRNVARLSAAPKGRPARRMAPPSVDDARAALAAAATLGSTAGLLVRLCLFTGARRGEVCALRWTDIDLDADPPVVTVARSIYDGSGEFIEKPTKTGSTRRIPLDPATTEALRAQHRRLCDMAADLRSDGPVWVVADDPLQPWLPQQASGAWKLIRRAAGVTCRLHDLRHFAATQLIAAGVPATDVAERLGHADASVTMRVYAHSTDAGQQRASDVLAGALG